MGVGGALVGQTQYVIDAGIVDGGKRYENVSGDIHVAALIVAVNALTALENGGYLGLGQVGIFAQITNPAVHTITS